MGRRFSLMVPRLDLPPVPVPAVPLDTADPRYGAYFAVLKGRIEDQWVYPQEATRRGQSGRGEARVTMRRDGSVQTVEIVKSSGVRILDEAFERAIWSAQPFPVIPDSIG